MARTELFARSQPGGVLTVTSAVEHPNEIYFVDSNSTTGSDAAGYGKSPDAPFLTIDYALGSNGATTLKADTVYAMPGHAETLTAPITVDKAGVKIVGLGEGTLRPSITVNGTVDGFDITADNVTIDGFYFPTPTAVATSQVNIAAANAKVLNCEFIQGANSRAAITITGAGEKPEIAGCKPVVTANGPTCFVDIEGVIDRPHIHHNIILGSDGTNEYDNSIIDFSGQAVTSPVLHDNVYQGKDDATPLDTYGDNASVVGLASYDNHYAGGTTNEDNVTSVTATLGAGAITAATFGANSIAAAAIANGAIDAATFAAGAIDAAAIADNAIDAAAIAVGAIEADAFAAGAINAAAIADGALDSATFAASAAEKTTDGFVITRATAALPQTTAAAIFTVTGLCLVKRIVGYVTSAIGNVPNATKLKVNSTGAGATTDICGTLDLDNKAAANYLQITGTFANPMVATLDIPIAKVQAAEIVVPPGAIEVDCAGSDGGGGRVKWSVTYVPLEAGASIVAA